MDLSYKIQVHLVKCTIHYNSASTTTVVRMPSLSKKNKILQCKIKNKDAILDLSCWWLTAKNDKIIVPTSLRQKVRDLQAISDEGDQGMSKCKSRIREFYW